MSYPKYGAADYLADMYQPLPGDPSEIDPAYWADDRGVRGVVAELPQCPELSSHGQVVIARARRGEGGRDDRAASEAPVPAAPDRPNVPERTEGQQAEQRSRSITERYPVLDWYAVWTEAPDAVDWLVEPLFERGRLYAVYGPAKAGKSLLLQDVAAGLATGRPVLGRPARDPVRVLYVDMENSQADIVERLSAYGYGPADLADLRYLSFPDFPALNSRVGGAHLRAVVADHGVELVAIDTVSRVIDGGENDADTFHALYRYALAPLKADRVTVVRLDHGGKDEGRGQRGSSAKSTDVDTVWRLELIGPDALTLTRVASRTTHHPERVHLVRRFEPLRHEITEPNGSAQPARTPDITSTITTLDKLGVPLVAGRDKCRKALTTAGVKVGNETLAAAVQARRRGCPQDQDR